MRVYITVLCFTNCFIWQIFSSQTNPKICCITQNFNSECYKPIVLCFFIWFIKEDNSHIYYQQNTNYWPWSDMCTCILYRANTCCNHAQEYVQRRSINFTVMWNDSEIIVHVVSNPLHRQIIHFQCSMPCLLHEDTIVLPTSFTLCESSYITKVIPLLISTLSPWVANSAKWCAFSTKLPRLTMQVYLCHVHFLTYLINCYYNFMLYVIIIK